MGVQQERFEVDAFRLDNFTVYQQRCTKNLGNYSHYFATSAHFAKILCDNNLASFLDELLRNAIEELSRMLPITASLTQLRSIFIHTFASRLYKFPDLDVEDMKTMGVGTMEFRTWNDNLRTELQQLRRTYHLRRQFEIKDFAPHAYLPVSDSKILPSSRLDHIHRQVPSKAGDVPAPNSLGMPTWLMEYFARYLMMQSVSSWHGAYKRSLVIFALGRFDEGSSLFGIPTEIVWCIARLVVKW